MTKKALIFLADGVEEMEFAISVDVMRRAGLDITIAGLPDNRPVKGGKGLIGLLPEIGISEAASNAPYDVIILPGGLPCCKAMAESEEVGRLLKEQEAAGRYIGAICAGPKVLKAHGIGIGKSLTAYPVEKDFMMEGNLYVFKEDRVVVDGKLITARSPGTAFEFIFTVVDKVVGKEKASEIAKTLLLTYE